MSSWVNRTVLSGSSTAQNGTSSHTCTFTPATSGDLLVAVVSGAITFTTPTGWTLVTSAVNNTGLYVFSKTAASGESSFSTTHNGSNYPILGVVYEFPSTSVVVGTPGSATNQPRGNTSGPNISNLSGIYTRFGARSIAINSPTGNSSTVWTNPTVNDYDAYVTPGTGLGDGLTIAYDNDCSITNLQSFSSMSVGGGAATSTEDVSFAISSADTVPTPLFIQGQHVNVITGVSSQTAVYDNPVTAGDLLAVAVSFQSITATATVADSLGNSYKVATGPLANGPLGFSDYIFYALSGSSGANTVTVTYSTTVTYNRVLIHEYANVDTLDATNGGIGSGGSNSSGNVTTKYPNELIFGWGITNNGTTSAGTGFTLRETANVESTEDQIAATTGSYDAHYPTDGSAWIIQVAAFYSSLGALPHIPFPWLKF